jgi:hypothetical protein
VGRGADGQDLAQIINRWVDLIWICRSIGVRYATVFQSIMGQLTLSVHPLNGQDTHDGTPAAPLKTLREALRRSEPGTVIELAAGRYVAANGEQFPIQIPPQRRVVGPIRGSALLQGSGALSHPVLGVVEVTCVAADQAQLDNLTLTNPEPRGIGLWIDQGRPIVQTVQCTGCDRYGLVILDEAIPTILATQLLNNGEAGLALFRRGKGALVRLQCRQNQVGIALFDQAAPLIQNCDISQNQTGITTHRYRATGAARQPDPPEPNLWVAQPGAGVARFRGGPRRGLKCLARQWSSRHSKSGSEAGELRQ